MSDIVLRLSSWVVVAGMLAGLWAWSHGWSLKMGVELWAFMVLACVAHEIGNAITASILPKDKEEPK